MTIAPNPAPSFLVVDGSKVSRTKVAGLLLRQAGNVELASCWIRKLCTHGPLQMGVPLAQCLGAPIEPRLAQAVRGCLDFGNPTWLAPAFHPMPLPLVRSGDTSPGRNLGNKP